MECGVIYMNPRIPPANIAAYYPANYYTNSELPGVQYISWRRSIRNAILTRYRSYKIEPQPPRYATLLGGILGGIIEHLDLVQRYITWIPGGRVLDIGCGNGQALSTYKALGWDTYGCEVATESARLAANAGHAIYIGQLADAKYPSEYFHVVTLWDTLEHVHNPGETLREVQRVLRPGGQVYISVPNAGSIFWLAFRDKWFMFTCPLHYFHYRAETLRYLLNHTGFEVSRILSTAGNAGVTQTIQVLATSRAWLRLFLLNRVAIGVLKRMDRVMPWGHLVGVGAKI
jgi:2-polyprenyl-3-methyl-5-hydroxy-6-metoxy-1,4-benzoquinol methylase